MATPNAGKRAGNSSSDENKKNPGRLSFWDSYKVDILYSALLVVGIMIFLGGAFFGGSVPASDNLASMAMQNYLESANSSGEFPLWIPHIFSGMPAYASLLNTGDRWWDVIHSAFYGGAAFFGSIFNSDVARVSLFYIIYGIGVYMLMISQKKDRYAAFFASFAAVFSTGIIVWLMIGHNTKPIVMAMLPWIFLCLERLRKQFSLIYAVLLTVVLHITFESTHVQMIFYAGVAVGLYLLFELVSRIIRKDKPVSILQTTGVLLLCGGLAFIISSDRYLAVMEYTDYSTRGAAPLVQDNLSEAQEHGGNDYQYATQWSFSPGEMIDFFVPNYHGYGKLEYDYEKPENKNKILSQVSKQYDGRLPLTYWSQKPFEDAPPYMGIIVFMFALVGFWSQRKNLFAQYLMVLSIFGLVLSFGYTFPILYDFFYYYVPSFDKFRAPSMSLALMQFSFPILAGFAVDMFLRNKITKKDKRSRAYKYNNALVIMAAVFLVAFVIFYAGFKDSYYAAVAQSKLAAMYGSPQILEELKEFLWNSTVKDWLVNAFIFGGAVMLVLAYTRNKINYVAFGIVMTFLLAFDLFRVSGRALEVSEGGRETEQFEQHRDWADWIKAQEGRARVAEFVAPTPNATAYFELDGVNGYHSAKMRVYQDMMDVAAQKTTSRIQNPFIWQITGTKYVVLPDATQGLKPVFQSKTARAVVHELPNALPRVFFVDAYEELDEMAAAKKLEYIPNGNFNPREIAYITPTDVSGLPDVKIDPVHTINKEDKATGQLDDPLLGGNNQQIKIDTLTNSGNDSDNTALSLTDEVGTTIAAAKAEITEFENQYIKIEATATGNNLLYISEVWYPKGWTTYLDGEEVETYRTNFAFRSVVVPEGYHVIELKFTSPKFKFGRTASMLASGILLGMLVVGLITQRKMKKGDSSENAESE